MPRKRFTQKVDDEVNNPDILRRRLLENERKFAPLFSIRPRIPVFGSLYQALISLMYLLGMLVAFLPTLVGFAISIGALYLIWKVLSAF